MIITINVEDGAENYVIALRDRLVDAATLLTHYIEHGSIDEITDSTAHLEQCAIQFAASTLARVVIDNKVKVDEGAVCGCEHCVRGN